MMKILYSEKGFIDDLDLFTTNLSSYHQVGNRDLFAALNKALQPHCT